MGGARGQGEKGHPHDHGLERARVNPGGSPRLLIFDPDPPAVDARLASLRDPLVPRGGCRKGLGRGCPTYRKHRGHSEQERSHLGSGGSRADSRSSTISRSVTPRGPARRDGRTTASSVDRRPLSQFTPSHPASSCRWPAGPNARSYSRPNEATVSNHAWDRFPRRPLPGRIMSTSVTKPPSHATASGTKTMALEVEGEIRGRESLWRDEYDSSPLIRLPCGERSLH